MAKKKFYVVSYDIVDDKKRTKAADILKDYGARVQKSVFECGLEPEALAMLLARLEKIVDKKVDSVLVYLLCETCRMQRQSLGQATCTRREEEFRVI